MITNSVKLQLGQTLHVMATLRRPACPDTAAEQCGISRWLHINNNNELRKKTGKPYPKYTFESRRRRMPRRRRRPMLSLSVREVTSVTATFVLSSKLDGLSDPTPASLGIDEGTASDGDDDDNDVGESRESSTSNASVAKPPSTSTPKHKSKSTNNKRAGKFGAGRPPGNGIIAQTVYKLLFLTVNGIRWQRAVVKIDDHLDEAIIIIFGLVQGREYEIEFLVAVDEQTARERAKEMERELGDGLERRVDKVVNFDEMANVQEVEKAGELGIIKGERKALEGGEEEGEEVGEEGDERTLTATLRTQVVTKGMAFHKKYLRSL